MSPTSAKSGDPVFTLDSTMINEKCLEVALALVVLRRDVGRWLVRYTPLRDSAIPVFRISSRRGR